MAARGSPDLWLLLTDPIEARYFISRYDWNCPREFRPDEIILNSGRTINFETMSDEDAVAAAMEIVRSIEIPLAMKEKQLSSGWEH